MPQCLHHIAYLHVQVRRNPQTTAPEYHLICDACGKDIPVELQNAFLWLKMLEMRDMIAGMTAVARNDQAARDPMGIV